MSKAFKRKWCIAQARAFRFVAWRALSMLVRRGLAFYRAQALVRRGSGLHRVLGLVHQGLALNLVSARLGLALPRVLVLVAQALGAVALGLIVTVPTARA